MKIVIIEDERITAEDLEQTIQQADATIEIAAILTSVVEGIEYFSAKPKIDLIFSDIRLGDGLSFEILYDLQVPVIFCTAYDEYALNAFKANGLDYIMKPFTQDTVSCALQKYKNFAQIGHEEIARQYESIKNLFIGNIKPTKETALLIRSKDKIIPIKTETAALFHLDNLVVELNTFAGETYYPSQSLEELERMLGEDFFRVNRQYLVNRKAVLNVSSLLSRKLSLGLSIKTSEPILISKEKAPIFLKWLSGMGDRK